MSDIVHRLARLEAAEDARNLMAAYATACDAEDVLALSAIFAPDMVLETPHRRCEGREAVLDFYREAFATGASSKRHFVTNVIVDRSGPQLVGRAYFIVVSADGDRPLVGWGHYRDTFAERDGRLVFVTKWIELELQVDARQGWAELMSRPAPR